MKEVILDINEWLPQEAIDQTIELIHQLENKNCQGKDINTEVHLPTAQHPKCWEKCRCDVVWIRMCLVQMMRKRVTLINYIIMVT